MSHKEGLQERRKEYKCYNIYRTKHFPAIAENQTITTQLKAFQKNYIMLTVLLLSIEIFTFIKLKIYLISNDLILQTEFRSIAVARQIVCSPQTCWQ